MTDFPCVFRRLYMNSLNDLWQEIIKFLAGKMNESALQTWFSDCEPVEMDDSRFVIHTSNDFKRDVINSRYTSLIKEALNYLFSADFDIVVLAGDEINDYVKTEKSDNSLPETAGYTFDRFIVGNSNTCSLWTIFSSLPASSRRRTNFSTPSTTSMRPDTR